MRRRGGRVYRDSRIPQFQEVFYEHAREKMRKLMTMLGYLQSTTPRSSSVATIFPTETTHV